MDIKDIQLNVATQLQVKVEKLKDENLETQTQTKPQEHIESSVSSVDSVSISPEAQALFNDGGGHPDRPPKG